MNTDEWINAETIRIEDLEEVGTKNPHFLFLKRLNGEIRVVLINKDTNEASLSVAYNSIDEAEQDIKAIREIKL
jgi:hypothetical protein